MTSVEYIQWLNENENRAYPLAEYATKLDDQDRLLPTDIIADVGLMLPPAHQDVYFTSIRITEQSVVVGVASSLSGLFIGTYSRAALTPYTAYPLTPLISDIAGWVVFGHHVASGIEDYRFAGPLASKVEMRAIRLVDELPVKRFIKFGGSEIVEADKIVTFQGGGGIVFDLDPADPTGHTIRVSLDDEHKYSFVSPCRTWAAQDICGAPPMRSFNGVCPDDNGRIELRFE